VTGDEVVFDVTEDAEGFRAENIRRVGTCWKAPSG
jgi:cold shock CspA family protein